MNIRQAFGQALREIRESQALTQEKLAEIAAVDRVSIYRYEKGLIQPNLESMHTLARALNITLSSLMERTESIYQRGA